MPRGSSSSLAVAIDGSLATLASDGLGLAVLLLGGEKASSESEITITSDAGELDPEYFAAARAASAACLLGRMERGVIFKSRRV